MDDQHIMVDEANVRSANGTLLWLHHDCNARMLVGRGALATTLVDASSEEEEEAEAEAEDVEAEAEAEAEDEDEDEAEDEAQAQAQADG